jgi:hypothetical protein
LTALLFAAARENIPRIQRYNQQYKQKQRCLFHFLPPYQ